ncbi:DUF4240 domain-containing protein [Planomicrobium sp. CPCC 101110]|uniref:DUF4240 domain-containing protein n=1 Tax=Planomicrobium sp. CPCC 101110 TaxID=2599619 RepID=UPI0011B5A4FE|nr:DUF4240 domain-containing protein [Planomicrobium sp. CPCC 101110]TWT25826.1 DUF4240 domain-containing protein [Planomicrobium sp. CPCC 101110]
MEAHLICQSSYSNKFWKITVAKNSFAVTYGRIGTAGTMRAKDFSSPEACLKEAHRLIGSKLKKGYRPAVAVPHKIAESAMTDSRFWELLEECKEHGGNPFEPLEWLVSHLSEKSVTDIISFDSFLREHYSKSYTKDLWAAATIAMGGCSEEGFHSFRAWMLSLGETIYYAAIRDPESLLPFLKLLEEREGSPQLKALLRVASNAYEVKTGSGFEDYKRLYEQLMGEDFNLNEFEIVWEEDMKESLRRTLPRLWAVFGENPL